MGTLARNGLRNLALSIWSIKSLNFTTSKSPYTSLPGVIN